MCVWALSCWDVITVEGGSSLTEWLSVFCCFLFPDWRCSSVCASREADPPATVASCCAWPGPVTVQWRPGFCASPSLQLHQLFIKPTQLVVDACHDNLLVSNCEVNHLCCPLPYLMCRSVKLTGICVNGAVLQNVKYLLDHCLSLFSILLV